MPKPIITPDMPYLARLVLLGYEHLKPWDREPIPGTVPWRLVPDGPDLVALLPETPAAFLTVVPVGVAFGGWRCWMGIVEPNNVIATSVLRRRGRKKPRAFDDRFQVSVAVAGMLEPECAVAGHGWVEISRFGPPPVPHPDA